MNAEKLLKLTAADIAVMVAAFDEVAKAPRDMKVRRIEAAAFALRDRYCKRIECLVEVVGQVAGATNETFQLVGSPLQNAAREALAAAPSQEGES